MHEVRFYTDAVDYHREVVPELSRDEPLHALPIGLAKRFVDSGFGTDAEGAPPGALLASVWKPDGRLDRATHSLRKKLRF